MDIDGLLTGLILPFAGTAAGAACVYFMKHELPERVQKSLLGFAAGVMVAASVWSLLIPSIEMSGGEGLSGVLPDARQGHSPPACACGSWGRSEIRADTNVETRTCHYNP